MMGANILQVKEADWQKEVLEAPVPVIVDFWAPWCGPCKFLGPIFEELAGEYTGTVKFVKLNTDEAQGVAIKYGIMGIPTLKVFKGGKELDTMSGAVPKDHLKEFIDKALAK